MDGFGIRPITVREEDGVLIAIEYPPLIGIADGFLASAADEYVDVADRFVTFRASNGAATYRLLGRDATTGVTLAERVEAPF